MSALVAVTICTAERQIHRFSTLAAADEFLSGRPATQTLRTSRKKKAPEILVCLSQTARADAGHIADALDASVDCINPTLRQLVAKGHIEIVDTKAHGRRIYSITNAGRAFLSTHTTQE